MSDEALPPERDLPPPPRWKAAVWTFLFVFLALLPLLGIVVRCAQWAYDEWAFDQESPSYTLVPTVLLALASGAAALLGWGGARKARRVIRGREPVPDYGVAVGLGVLALGGYFASIVGPKAGELIRNANEGAVRGNLGAVRSALSIYYGDLEGAYPEDLRSLTVAGKYMTVIPAANIPVYHRGSARVRAGAPDDTGGWAYNNRLGDANYGSLWVNCTHTDVKGSVWTAY